MTDTSAARAYPPEREGDDDPAPRIFPPAAHSMRSPELSNVATAVLDSEPPMGFLGPASPNPALASADPPPFGFNAPHRPDLGRAGVPVTLPQPEEGDPGEPSADLEGTRRPRPAQQPRELMPPVTVPMRHRRFGDTPTPTFGPPGRRRSTAAMVVLSILTLGFYAVGWHRRVNQEMADFDPRIHVVPARSAWAVAMPLVIGLLASAAAAARVLLGYFGVHVDVPVTAQQALPAVGAIGAVPYLVLFLPFSLLAVAMTAERVRVVEEHAGLTGDEQLRPAAAVGWLLFPVLGGFVLMGRMQRRLNRIWDLAAG